MKILISGCSFTEHRNWPNLIFDSKKHSIKNLGRSAAGNNYISNSITGNLDYKPDFVFILWSGINRIDLRVPDSQTMREFSSIDEKILGYKWDTIKNSLYYFSGGGINIDLDWVGGYNNIKDDSWPEITSVKQWFELPDSIKQECLNAEINLSAVGGKPNLAKFYHQYFLTQNIGSGENQKYRSELSFQQVVNCQNLLEKLHIPYRFSFIYDIFSEHHRYSLGKAIKEHYYQYIDWSKYINLNPYDYGIKHDLLEIDGFHLTEDGFNRWGLELAEILKTQPDLKYLF